MHQSIAEYKKNTMLKDFDNFNPHIKLIERTLKRHGQRHVNHSPIDHPYKRHENTNHSRVPQLSKAPIPTSK